MMELLRLLCTTDTVLLILVLVIMGEKLCPMLVKIRAALTKGKFKSHVLLKQHTAINIKISKMLETYRDKTNASRASFFVFHNGGQSLTGVQFLRFSLLEQAIAKGVCPCITQQQGVHIQLIPEWIESMLQEDFSINKLDGHTTVSYERLLKTWGVHKVAYCPVWCHKSLVGFVTFEWTSPRYAVHDDIFVGEKIASLSQMIEIEYNEHTTSN